jgi:hypothetical protein
LVEPAQGVVTCPICQGEALVGANRLVLWHSATDHDGAPIDCPGIGTYMPGVDSLGKEAA